MKRASDMRPGDVAWFAYQSRHVPIPEGWEHHDDLVGHPSRIHAFLIRQVDPEKPLPPRRKKVE
jgi:hypothetical protein